MDDVNASEASAEGMSDKEVSARADQLEEELRRMEALVAKLEAEHEAMLREGEALDRQIRALEGEVKRAEAELFILSNPPKYLREMLGL